MSYQAYPEYKESGSRWLGEIPALWSAAPAKSLFALRSEKSNCEDEHLTPSQKYGVLPQSHYMKITGNKVVLNLVGSDSMKHVEPDDFVIHLRSFQGGIEHSPVRGKVSNAYTVLIPNGSVYPQFFRWALKSDGYIQELRTTTDQLRDGQSIKFPDFGMVRIPSVPLAEQKQIADFLDRETQQIDNLIAEQQGLVGNLTERSKAVISHAVTKGLNPEAELKDSGLEWSRQIPAGWVIDRISHLFRLISSGTTPDNDDLVGGDGDVCWVTTGELRENYISGTRQAVSFEIVQRTPTLKVYPPGTLLIAMYGATIGRLGILNVPACTNQACCAMSGPLGVETRFIYFAFQGALEHIMLLASGGGQPNINQDKVRSFRIPVPPLPEQREIVAYLENQTALIAELIEEAKALIDLLKERRSALISAAVTGKIDVRSEVLSRG